MSPQKACILMYPLDNGKAGYTWNEEWNLPYESLWGRIEKFRAVNVLESGQLGKIIHIGADSTYTIFCPQLLIYRKQAFKIMQVRSFLHIDAELFTNFTHLDGIFDNRLRYCPICMKSGYHSFLHQLYFLDECFIHQKTPLLYRCSCINTYILKRKRIADVTAFQCEQCDKKIAVAPSMSDGILEFWRKDNICKRLRRINKYKKINIVDVLLLYQEKGNSFHRYTEFSTTQKAVLKDLILTGKTKQTPRLFIVRDLAESTHKIVMSEALNQYILNKYEHNVILKHFWHISDRYCRYEIGEHNIELLSIFFLIKELQCKSYVDQLNYGLRRDLDGNIKRIFLSDNEYSDAIFLIQRISFQLGIDIDDYIELYNFILMEFTLARYKHIYSCFRDNHPSEYPCTSAASVSYNNWNYPVYIIVKNKEDEILLY